MGVEMHHPDRLLAGNGAQALDIAGVDLVRSV